ncbi:chaplin [Kitasatospora sp. NPDC092948]|uniref:chaplin n=1 Tax=Kitasatospora sp. NPDC092948 TaxID=3364088 RepID=UPI00382F7DAD
MRKLAYGAFGSAAAATLLLGTGGAAMASSDAEGVAANSAGVVSGNQIQVPVHVPVNVCGNSINIVGLLNPAFGNTCANGG